MNIAANVTIRRASAGDIPALARVWHDGWNESHAALDPDIAAGHKRIWLQCRVGNERARRFYEKHGWAVAGEVNTTLGHVEGRLPVLVWRMEKPLV